MKSLPLLICLLQLSGAATASSGEWLTVAERTDYGETSLYSDVIEFIAEAQRRSDLISNETLAISREGREIPLLCVSSEGIRTPAEAELYAKPVVLIVANIHAGEVDGKEAVLMLLRDFASGELDGLLESQVVLLVPIFNPDGNDKLGDNRRDNGPPLAGVRHNGQHLDLNRDFIKLETPEVNGLVAVLRNWKPILFVDLHTTNGSYHQEPVTYATLSNPGSSTMLQDYMWETFFPAVAQRLEQGYGVLSLPYGNFVDRTQPSKGWKNHAFAARYGTNYVGLRNIFTVLDENYSHADFKTRVTGCHGFVRSILEFTASHGRQMQTIQRRAAVQTRESYHQQPFVIDYDVTKLFDLTVKSYEFIVEPIKPEDRDKYPPWIGDFSVKRTDVKADYDLPYLAKTVATETISLPQAYLVPPFQDEIIANLEAHGIILERVAGSFEAVVEEFRITEVTLAEKFNQGRVPVAVSGNYETVSRTIPEGTFLVDMRQPMARLIPVLLEPQSEDSLLYWGFFGSGLVSQWRNKPQPYRVLRLPQIPAGLKLHLHRQLP